MPRPYYVNAGTFQRKLVADCAVNAALEAVRGFIAAKSIPDEKFELLLPKMVVIHERGFRTSHKDSREGDIGRPIEISSEYLLNELCNGNE